MIDYIETEKVERTWHGSVVVGKKTTKYADELWWSKWKKTTLTAYYDDIKATMVDMNVVYDVNQPLLSGVVSALYTKEDDRYKITVPVQPLFFGVRLVIVNDSFNVYFIIDPDCYTELPSYFVAWIAGILSQFHDQTIGCVQTLNMSWSCVREWIETKKDAKVYGVRAWDIFSDIYTQMVQQCSQREAYRKAVEISQERIKEIEYVASIEEFMSQIQNTSNITQLLDYVKSVAVKENHSKFLSCVETMKRMRDAFIDFEKEKHSFESELAMIRTVFQQQCAYEDLLNRVETILSELKNEADIREEYGSALYYALRLVENEYRTSDLYAVHRAVSAMGQNVIIEYETSSIKNKYLERTLNIYNREKSQPSNEERSLIEKATTFCKGTSVLSWKIEQFYELLENHRKMIALHKSPAANAGNFLDRIKIFLESEKWGRFYRNTVRSEHLMRNGMALDEYVAKFNSVTNIDHTTSVKNVLRKEICQAFDSIDYWKLLDSSTRSSVIGTLQTLCDLATRLGSAEMPSEQTWPDLPLVINNSPYVFRNRNDVDECVTSFKNFKKPTLYKWPLLVSDLAVSKFNHVVYDLVGSHLVKTWNKSVIGEYDTALKRVEGAKETYESTISEILRLVESQSCHLFLVYNKTISKCHKSGRNTNEYKTWWELVDSEFLLRCPDVFQSIANVSDRQTFIQQVVENKWNVAMIADAESHERWKEELSLKLLRWVRDSAAKDLLTEVEKKMVEAIEERSKFWRHKFATTDRDVGNYFNVEFISGEDTAVVPSAQFRQLSREMIFVLTYATHIYGPEEVGKDLFNWIVDGYGRWMVTGHISQFSRASSPNMDDFNDPLECFYGVLVTWLSDFLSLYDICHTSLIRHAQNLYDTLVKYFPVYGRIVSKMSQWNMTYITETHVDVFERLRSDSSEIPRREPMNASKNIALTKKMLEIWKQQVDIPFLEQCLSGNLWVQSDFPSSYWKSWNATWFQKARQIVFANKEKNLLYFLVDENEIYKYDELIANNDKLRYLVNKQKPNTSRNVLVKLYESLENQTEEIFDTEADGLPPNIATAKLTEELAEIIYGPEEDEYYYEEDFNDQKYLSFYNEPPFEPVSLRQELIDAGVEPPKINDRTFDDIAAQIEELHLQQSDDTEQLVDNKEEAEKGEKYETRRYTVKSKNFKRHLQSLREFFQFLSHNG